MTRGWLCSIRSEPLVRMNSAILYLLRDDNNTMLRRILFLIFGWFSDKFTLRHRNVKKIICPQICFPLLTNSSLSREISGMRFWSSIRYPLRFDDFCKTDRNFQQTNSSLSWVPVLVLLEALHDTSKELFPLHHQKVQSVSPIYSDHQYYRHPCSARSEYRICRLQLVLDYFLLVLLHLLQAHHLIYVEILPYVLFEYKGQ